MKWAPFLPAFLFLWCSTQASLSQVEIPQIIRPLPSSDDTEIIWSVTPEKHYRIDKSTTLASDSWTEGEVFKADNSLVRQVLGTSSASQSFYRLVRIDREGPVITRRFPDDGAYSVNRFADFTIAVTDESGVNPASIQLVIGSQAALTVGGGLTFENGTIGYNASGSAHGGFEEAVPVTLTIADTLGNSVQYQWSFTTQLEDVVVDDLLVFGSASAQKSGQLMSKSSKAVATAVGVPIVKKSAIAGNWAIKTIHPDSIVVESNQQNSIDGVFFMGQHLANTAPAKISEIFYRKITGLGTPSQDSETGKWEVTLTTVEVSPLELASQGSLVVDDNPVLIDLNEQGDFVVPAAASAKSSNNFEHQKQIALLPLVGQWDNQVIPDDPTAPVRMTFDRCAFKFDPDLTLEFDSKAGKVQRFKATLSGETVFNCKPRLHLQFTQPLSYSKVLIDPSLPQNRKFIKGSIGPVPIWVEARWGATLNLSAEATGTAQFSSGVLITQNTSCVISYDKDRTTPFQVAVPTPTLTKKVSPLGIDAQVSLDGEINIQPTLELLIYSVVGVELSVTPYVKGKATVNGSTSGGTILENTVTAEAYAGVRIGAVGTIEFSDADDDFTPYTRELIDPPIFLGSLVWPEPDVDDAPAEFDWLVQPESRTVNEGGDIELSAAAVGNDVISYQWYKDNVPVPGATGQRYVVTGARLNHAGEYRCIASMRGASYRGDGANVRVIVRQQDVASYPPTPSGFVTIPAGSFVMGDTFGEGLVRERPIRTVSVSEFAMQKTEVTNAQMANAMNWALSQGLISASYLTVKNKNGIAQELLDMDGGYIEMSWNGSKIVVNLGKERYPCMGVSWYGAAAYCTYLSLMEGKAACYDVGGTWGCDFSKAGYRLPTEAEWEKAARGGLNGMRFPLGNEIDHVKANFYSTGAYGYDLALKRGYHPDWAVTTDGFRHTNPVGVFPANGYGLYDMAGNVYEWCNDMYNENYYESSSNRVDPIGPVAQPTRVIRGGSWRTNASSCRVSNRGNSNPENHFSHFGFRVVTGSR